MLLVLSFRVEFPAEVHKRIHTASASASDDLETKQVDRQITKWQNHLTSEQADRILEIVHLYDLD